MYLDVIDYNLLSTDAIEVLTAEPTIGNVLWIIKNARIFIYKWLLVFEPEWAVSQ